MPDRKPKSKGTDRCVDCGFEFDDSVQGGRLRCARCRMTKEDERKRVASARWNRKRKPLAN